MKPYALVSNVKNEAVVLPLWLKYYLQFFDPSDVYVGDDSSTDSTMTLLQEAGVNIEMISAYDGQHKHRHLINYITTKTAQLLASYQVVLFVECDEFVVPVTGDLREHLTNFSEQRRHCNHCRAMSGGRCEKHEFQVCDNLEIIQDIDNEPALDLTQPIMAQRSHALNVPKFNNAQLWAVPPRWTEGYHDVDKMKPGASRTMWLVHLHHADYDICNARHKSRKPLVDNIVFSVEEDEELRTFFRTKLVDPGMYYNYPQIVEIPPQVKVAF